MLPQGNRGQPDDFRPVVLFSSIYRLLAKIWPRDIRRWAKNDGLVQTGPQGDAAATCRVDVEEGRRLARPSQGRGQQAAGDGRFERSPLEGPAALNGRRCLSAGRFQNRATSTRIGPALGPT